MDKSAATRSASNDWHAAANRASRRQPCASTSGALLGEAGQRTGTEFDAHNERAVAHQRLVDNSPRVTAQRKQIESAFGMPVQRQGAAEEDELLQGKFEAIQRQGPEEEELLQGKFGAAQLKQEPAPQANDTGLPDNLKAGIEHLSGMSMDDVKVHYNSSQPAQLNALAYAQGTDIHVAPGQDRHLPHEAWHVVQQAQGRVQPTMQMNDGALVNDDEGLEHEADVMGAKALTNATQRQSAPGKQGLLQWPFARMQRKATDSGKPNTKKSPVTPTRSVLDKVSYSLRGESAEGLLGKYPAAGVAATSGSVQPIQRLERSDGPMYLAMMDPNGERIDAAVRWRVEWTGADDKYKLEYLMGELEHPVSRPSKAEFEFQIPKRGGFMSIRENPRVVNDIVWDRGTNPSKAYVYVSTGNEDAPADIWAFTINASRDPVAPFPFINQGEKTQEKGGGLTKGTSGRIRKKEKAHKFDAKKVFMSGLKGATTLAEVADTIYDNIREHKSLKYSSSGQIKTETLLTGSIDMAVCHATSEAFVHAVNASAAALGIDGTATLESDANFVLTNNNGTGLLGWPGGTTNITKKDVGGVVSAYDGARIVFSSHTWVRVNGAVYDAVAGIKGGGDTCIETPLAGDATTKAGGNFTVTKNEDGPQGPLAVPWTIKET